MKRVCRKDKKEDENIAKFYFDDYLILVGKNEKGNIKLLKESKASDIWLHIKDKKGSHVIIKTNKDKLIPIVSTNLELKDNENIEIYKRRWDI